MEAVRAFNNELSSLYETRPPISRAKMANVTKCAIKAIKFYKHVVQSVEKFIQKCKPEYKVPGLYVIDSIVRQSRHQFGAEKDVFAPRFTKNVVSTFQHLFKCPNDEKSKVVRVLNLWQKNGVFQSEVVQPLLDLAADPNDPNLIAAASRACDALNTGPQQSGPSSSKMGGPSDMEGDPDMNDPHSAAAQNDMLNTVTQLLQQTQQGSTSLSAQQQQLQQLQLLQQQLIQQTQLMQQPSSQTGPAPVIDNNLLSHIQTLTNQLLSKPGDKSEQGGFNKKLLDFDYGESDDEDVPSQGQQVHNLLSDPALMQQIQQMSQTIQKTEQLQNELSMQKLLQQQAEFDNQIRQPPMMVNQNMPPEPHPPPPMQPGYPPPLMAAHPHHPEDFHDIDERSQEQIEEDRHRESDRDRDRERKHRRSKHSRDRSRSRTPKRRRRSRSRSRDRRRRSRSRDRHRRSRSRDRERERQREKERERRKKGLPSIREECLSICSTTLFIGHLAKNTTEEELREEVEKYGTIETLHIIPPRGCAFVCMSRRKDANKALDRLKGYKLNGSDLRVAWAPGIGVKESEFRDKWDVEVGTTYIEWNKLPEDITPLIGGGIIDEDTLPEHLKGTLIGREKPDANEDSNPQAQPPPNQMPNTQGPPPPMGIAPGAPPGAPGPPPGTPAQGQFPPVPGMLPPATVMQSMGVMQQMMLPGGMAPGQLPTGPMPPGQMGVAPGMPHHSGQAPLQGMIPLPGGLPTPRPQVGVSSASSTVAMAPGVSSLFTTSGAITPASQAQMNAGIRLGFPPPAGFPPRFGMGMPPQGFRMPSPFDQALQQQPPNSQLGKPALLGMRPPFESSQSQGSDKDKATLPGIRPPGEWNSPMGKQKQLPSPSGPGFPQDLDKDEREGNRDNSVDNSSQPPSSSTGVRPPFGSQGMQSQDQSGGPGMGPRPPNPGMGPMGNFRGPRPLMNLDGPGGPNMGGPRMGGPPDGPNRFMGPRGPMPPGSMGPRGFQGPGGMRPGFMGNRPGMPFQRFPGNFPPRPGFRGPPGDMMRPRFDIGNRMDGEMGEDGEDNNDEPNFEIGGGRPPFGERGGPSNDRWGENDDEPEENDFQDGGNFRRDFNRRDRGRRGRGGGWGGRGGRDDFGGRDNRRGDYDRRDRRGDDRYNRDDRGGRGDWGDNRGDRGEWGDRGSRDRRDRDRGEQDRDRDRGRDRRDRERDPDRERRRQSRWSDANDVDVPPVLQPEEDAPPVLTREGDNTEEPFVPKEDGEIRALSKNDSVMPPNETIPEDVVKPNGPENGPPTMDTVNDSLPPKTVNGQSEISEPPPIVEGITKKDADVVLEEGEIE